MPRKTPQDAIHVLPAPGVASMRPRPDAAENPDVRLGLAGALEASMRPRPDAAENAEDGACRTPGGDGFNEAAARCRGKRC